MSVLSLAEEIVGGERRAAYGDPGDSFARVATVWTAILGFPVTASQVVLCMAGLKLIREAHRHKPDNLVDLAGYARIAELIQESSGACGANVSNVGVAGGTGGE